MAARGVVGVLQVFQVHNSDPSMARYSQYDLLTKDGFLYGYQSLTVLVPELKGGTTKVECVRHQCVPLPAA